MIAPPVPAMPSMLRVRERRLYISSGTDAQEEVPYQDSDFVLLGISGSRERGDESLLPFHDLKVDALMALWEPTNGIELAKANLIAAYQQMRKSPDVTQREASAMFDNWLLEFEEERKRTTKIRSMPDRRTREYAPTLPTDVGIALRRIEEKSHGTD